MAVGDRRRFSEQVDSPVIGALQIYSSPETIVSSWPARLFRVGDFVGFQRRDFQRDISGWCQGYTVLEEIPAQLAFGPGGARAVAIAEQAVGLDAAIAVALGEAANAPARPRQAPAHQAVRAARERLFGRGRLYPAPRDPAFSENRSPKARRWVAPRSELRGRLRLSTYCPIAPVVHTVVPAT